ncbi:CD109 antigen-like [Drosophila rhopaloa]|uniref:CD109 antigen n=1 Tax=Drosophila rhopaloa TaxID=1041015 RepID=A0ABM5JB69_DRORH|nr:CD109 antigen-like [Drosophila rhopaloa]
MRLILISILLHYVLSINAENIYSIVAAKNIRPNSPFNVAVTVHSAHGPTYMTLSIKGPSFDVKKSLVVPPMTSQNVAFDIPKITNGDYQLIAQGVGGIVFQKSESLQFSDDKDWIYIQTDKATYKPSDAVQFRVLFLNRRTQPATIDKPITIEIHDGANNMIKKWENVKPTNGVFTEKLQLSDQPVLGNWTMTVKVQDRGQQTKTFVVDTYVMPKFEVKVITPRNIVNRAGKITATIKATYTFKKPVKGTLVVSLEGSGTERTLPIDGAVNVEFPFAATAKSPLKIVATVTEELTDLKHNGTAQVNLHEHRYQLEEYLWPTTYIPGKNYTIRTVVRNLDGSPVLNSPMKVMLDVLCCQNNRTRESTFPRSIASHTFIFPDNTCKSCLITAKLENAVDFKQYTYKLEKSLKIEVITNKPKLRQPLTINVVSDNYLPYFMLAIVARGNIIINRYIQVEGRQFSRNLTFVPSFDMVPQATIIVQYVVNGELHTAEKTVDIEKDFGNTIEITAPEETEPKQNVSLRVKTDPNSFVGLLGVDQSVLLLRFGDLNRNQILNNLLKYSTDVVTITNANIYIDIESGGCYTNPDDLKKCYAFPPSRSSGIKSGPEKNSAPTAIGSTKTQGAPPAIRKLFPETWFFDDISDVGDNGEIYVPKTMPITMTSWVISGFSLNAQTGLAVTRDPTFVRVFQPFFATTNLPYSVKRNEVVAIPVLVFNYLGGPVRATVSMDNSDREYEFVEATSANVTKELLHLRREKSLYIPANTGRSISFMIRPKKIGLITLKITALAPNAGDTIHERLKVKADGVTKYVNKAVLINVQRLHRRHTMYMPQRTITVEQPEDIVSGTMVVGAAVAKTIQAPQLDNLNGLVRAPFGCGEQNMMNFVPNVLVLGYLENRKNKNPALSAQAKTYLETGYQRELTYKRDDWSFSAFGQSDRAGSTWLTAYVLRSFHQAQKFVHIDDNVMTRGLDFLESRQVASGEFQERGRVIHNSHGSPLALTSFVLLAFFENKEYMNRYQRVIDQAVQFVAQKVDQSNNPYDLAIAALALQLAKNSKAEQVLISLESMANKSGDRKWWTRSDNSVSNDVETTAYVLLALLEKESMDSTDQIVNWLISKRNSNGGFASSQDTVVGLMALTKYGIQSEKPQNVNFRIDTPPKKTIVITDDSNWNTKDIPLPDDTRDVKFSASGNGRVQFQIQYRFNVATKEKEPSFKLTTIAKKSDKQRIVLDICGEYTPVEDSDKGKPTNMAVMQIKLPSGYVSDPESFANIKAIADVKRVESLKADTRIDIYFDRLLPNVRKCMTVKAILNHPVANLRPSYVILYDYYQKERIATEYYNVESSLCDVCHGEECGDECL